MGWLSLVTKVVPKVLTGGTKATSTLWRGGTTVVGAGWKTATTVAAHPKTAIATAVGGWALMHKSENPKESMGTAVGKTVRESVDGSGGFVHDVVNGFTGKNTVEEVKDTASNVLDSTTSTLSELKDTVTESKGLLGTLSDSLKGIGTFLGNMFGGNGMNMFGNFFNNMASGKVGGLSIGALILGAYMIFGRTGMLGKLGGALLAMMMIGGNSQRQTQVVAQPQGQQLAENQTQGMHR